MFDFTSYAELDTVVNNIGPGYYIWVAKDFSNDWNVYRVTETKINVMSLSYTIDNLMSVEFSDAPSLSIGDVFAIKQFNDQFDGFYQVYAIDGVHSVKVVPHKYLDILKNEKVITGIGIFYTLQTARISTLDKANGLIPLNGWNDGDKLWVDSAVNGKWGVYKKETAWNYKSSIHDDINQAIPNSGFGTAITTNSTGTNMFIGMPSRNLVKVFAKNNLGNLNQVTSLQPSTTTLSSLTNYGKSLAAATTTVAVGAPTSLSGKGLVAVHDFTTGAIQFISNVGLTTTSNFGTSLASSDNGEWLYIGAPGDNKIYTYRFDSTITQHSNTVTWSGGNIQILNWGATGPTDVRQVRVFNESYNFVPGVDFTLSSNISGNIITFTPGSAPSLLSTVSFVQSP